jgi:uroporphyrinogen-III decarboxylase
VDREAQRLLDEREQRICNAIALKKPDRIPVFGYSGIFGWEKLGISREEQMNDPQKAGEAAFQMNAYFEPDLAMGLAAIGPTLDALGFDQMKWAGHGLATNSNHQWTEAEIMKPEEYDEFIYDPSDYVARKYWPRAYKKLGIFEVLQPLCQTVGYFETLSGFLPFGTKQGLEGLEALKQAGTAAVKAVAAAGATAHRLKEAGFPLAFGGMSQPPFDVIGDFLRGRKGIMVDMYRRPEKILQACEKLLPRMVEMGAKGARMAGNSRVFIALHGCIEGFMSVEQFKKFYWPTWRELMVQLIAEGCTPVVLVEGGFTSRLETIADVPPGKIWYWFEQVDMKKAKNVLGGKVCIGGNVPLSVLTTGTPDEVREHCRVLIDTVGRDGGYIMSPAGSPEDAKLENIKAMIDFTKEYGTY